MSHIERRLQGLPLCPGVALGRGCLYQETISHQDSGAGNVTYEEGRLQKALEGMSRRLGVLAREAGERLDSETADIFWAQRMILEDPVLRQRLFEAVSTEGLNAEAAVEEQLERYQAELRGLDSEYLRERAADLAELQRGLLDRLRQVVPYLRCKDVTGCKIGQCRLGNDHILIAPELTPGLAIQVSQWTRGFLVEKGGRHSHAAILAKALGLPAVSGIHNVNQAVPLAAQILLDGGTGEVVLNPSQETLDAWRTRIGAEALPAVDPVPHLKVMANIDRSAGVWEALAAQAEGIGLYRTEVEALAKGRLLTEAEQEAHYLQVLEAMAGKPLYIRLLDLGADKAADWLNLPQEDNPALGCRGARLLLSRPELLRVQARALARASARGPIHVIYPMIVDLEQFRRLRALFDLAVADLSPGRLLHGIMFEVPSACLQARRLFEEADFGCIGTNDLVQYLFAADRGNENIDCNDLLEHPLLWDLIQGLAKTANEAGKTLSICGELAGDPRFTPRIIDAGIMALSVSPWRIAQVRRAAIQRRG